MNWLGDAGGEPENRLPSGSCGVVLEWGQSNIFGQNSWLPDVTRRAWSDSPREVKIWDQIKRNTRHEHAFVDTSDPTEANALSRFRQLTPGYGASGLNYMWDPAFEQVAQGDPFGNEMQLGYELRRHYRVPIRIIKPAYGGTQVANLGAGNPDWNVAGLDSKPESLLQLMRDYYWGAGLNAILEEGFDRSQIYMLGVVSMIGAADSNAQADADAYEANFGAIVDEVRSWISPSSPGTVPWVVVRSEPYYTQNGGTTNGHTYISTVRAAQEAVVAAKSSMTLVSCDDCERENGGVGEHITADGNIVLGGSIARGIKSGTPLQGPFGEVDPTA